MMHHSTPLELNQYEYDIFGETTLCIEEYNNPFRYSGEYTDEETGNVYLRARYYNPETGRFITRDSFAGIKEQPNTLNRYVYCGNDPVNYVDPSGHLYEGAGWEAYVEEYMSHPEDDASGIVGRIIQQKALSMAAADFAGDEGPSYMIRFGQQAEMYYNMLTKSANSEGYVSQKNNVDLFVARKMIESDMQFGNNKYGTFDPEGHPKEEALSQNEIEKAKDILSSMLGGVALPEIDPVFLSMIVTELNSSLNVSDSLSPDEVWVRIRNKTTKGIIIDDRTYLKIRDLGESLGGIVTYDNKTNTATIALNEQTITITTDQKTNQQVVKLNGEVVDAEVKLINGSNYIPLRKISNLLKISDEDIGWNGNFRIAYVQRQGVQALSEDGQKVFLDSIAYLTESKGFYFDEAKYLSYDASKEDEGFVPLSPTAMKTFQLLLDAPIYASVLYIPNGMYGFSGRIGVAAIEYLDGGDLLKEPNFIINGEDFINGIIDSGSMGKSHSEISIPFATFIPHEIIHLLRYAYGAVDTDGMLRGDKGARGAEEAWAIYVQNQIIKELNDAKNLGIPYRYDGSSKISIPYSDDKGNNYYGYFSSYNIVIPEATDIEAIIKQK